MEDQITIHPKKWRETCDPFALNFTNFKLNEILGYPHAGNDVFHVKGVSNGKEIFAFIKVARRKDADLINEVNILNQLDIPFFPRVIDYDRENGSYSVTEALPGMRLSAIIENESEAAAVSYMEKYGEALGRLHKLKINASAQSDRKFRHRPPNEVLEKTNLMFMGEFFDRKPAPGEAVFCHGDFHYANVLWKDHGISAILDFELAGYGDRDFDIAWALFLRPGQKFLKTSEEQETFIKGYKRHGNCNIDAVKYYMAQCYVYFMYFCEDDEDYCQYIREWLDRNCRS